LIDRSIYLSIMAAGNEWIYSYLEAILDTGERINDSRKQTALGEKDSFKAAKYFVDEVTGFDESSLYRTWIKASSMRSSQERSSRMESLCWRIWHIARKKRLVKRAKKALETLNPPPPLLHQITISDF
jgi:sucrose-phosphate synthase